MEEEDEELDINIDDIQLTAADSDLSNGYFTASDTDPANGYYTDEAIAAAKRHLQEARQLIINDSQVKGQKKKNHVTN